MGCETNNIIKCLLCILVLTALQQYSQYMPAVNSEKQAERYVSCACLYWSPARNADNHRASNTRLSFLLCTTDYCTTGCKQTVVFEFMCIRECRVHTTCTTATACTVQQYEVVVLYLPRDWRTNWQTDPTQRQATPLPQVSMTKAHVITSTHLQ